MPIQSTLSPAPLLAVIAPLASTVFAAMPDFADYEAAPEPASTAAARTTVVADATSSPAARFSTLPLKQALKIWERDDIHLKDFKLEGVFLLVVAAYLACYFIGKSKNTDIAKKWWKNHGSVLSQQFVHVGAAKQSTGALTYSSPSEYISYASGRKTIKTATIFVDTVMRHDPISLLFDYGYRTLSEGGAGMLPVADRVTIEIEADEGAWGGYVWGLVEKGLMRAAREQRWDLGYTATKDHKDLPREYTVMSESAEITEFIMADKKFVEAVKNCNGALEYVIVSDQKKEAPNATKDLENSPRRITLSVRADKKSPELISAVIDLADHLAKATRSLRPEVTRKVTSNRADTRRKLEKLEKEAEAEELRAKRDRKKAEEEAERKKALSPEEQKKLLDKERQRAMKRAQGKGAKVRK
ncbi:DUF1682-domain-containing protein [Saitoella complicata NRRL Y-17804]|uniref:DUF1682-domain-containing protein n=1 Tax=Saitoella complicata (strain BCRC 22490 / CBS 7301 / JCM 7358 / NBRC 10748 / NRRL Y-17804) TaxID=698492 RepID=A0A0E9NAM8_SAICN|nr:DUF1682-domain-containing protein [Saitoella complicata NRRL Y-17804]ODQ53870.1 DUF1682-domain-containing protein [Saitoella complicata NRRL Y-17804]GAO46922.1 hypothetical protein G7K_1140-t1 [Saitoella complicata NRRL Y-17804]